MTTPEKLRNIKGRLAGQTARPKHKLPFSSKKSKANGDASDWGMNAIDYYGTQTCISTSIKQEMRVLYRLANGVIDESDYSFVLNPYGEEQRKREALQGDPARLRNYDIVGPVMSRIVGDFMIRDTNFQVVATNSDVEERRQEQIHSQMKAGLMQQFRNELANQGIDTGFSNQEAELQVDQILSDAAAVPDAMTVKGQRAMDYIQYYNELERKYRMGLGDYMTVGRVFSYRDVFRDNTVFEIVHPMDFNYVANQNEEFVEDGESCYKRMSLTVGETIDLFREDLDDVEIDWLESEYGMGRTGFGDSREQTLSDVDNDWRRKDMDTFFQNVFGERRNKKKSNVIVKHVTFRSKRKLGYMTVYNMMGEPDTMEVDEDFKPRAGEEVEWVWVDEIWEGYKIGDNIYKRVRPLPLQRGDVNDPTNCKLPYNGRTFGSRTSIPNTPVKKGKSHQELYNILKYRLERTIAKNKDKFTIIPLGLVPEKDNMDMFSMMYYADYHGYMYVDESDPKKMQALQHIRAVDASMREYIKFLHDICTGIRAEYLEIVGIPRQKMADIKASDDVGNTQTALNEASLILEDSFVSFEEFMEKDYTALLELSKFSWINGRKAQFLNTEGEMTWIDIDPFMHTAADYSIFVKGNKSEREKLRQMKALSQAFAQNSATPTMVGKILQANNFDSLMKELGRMEKEMQQSQQANAEAEQALAVEDQKNKKDELDFKYYKTDADNASREKIAYGSDKAAISTSMVGEEAGNAALISANEKLDDLYSKGQDAAVESDKTQASRDNKMIDLAIAKENKNQYDKKS